MGKKPRSAHSMRCWWMCRAATRASWVGVPKRAGGSSPVTSRHLVELQTKLLNQGCDRVRHGGKVVYSTCSIEPEENRQVVQSVLDARTDVTLEADETATPGRPADGGYWARLRRCG